MRYVVAIDGAGEYESDFHVIVVGADTPRMAVDRLIAEGYGRQVDGLAYVVPLDLTSIFRINDTTQRVASPTSFSAVVKFEHPSSRQFIDPDGGHPRA